MSRIRRAAIRTAMAQDWLVKLAARRRQQGLDAGLDPQIAAALEYKRLMRMPELETMDPVAARVFAEDGMSAAELPPAPMAQVIDTFAGFDRIPVRIYVPHGANKHWIVWNHGGGGVIGSIQASDAHTRYLAAKTKCTVASVGYRLGPEDRHPAAIDDACTAFEALAARVPAGGKIAVGGDSFGGFLTAHIDHHTRHEQLRAPDLQIMIYPIVDLRLVSPSIERLGNGDYLLTKAMMHWFRSHYLNSDDEQVSGSPWFWDDVAGSAPAIIATAGFDPLVEEGDAWAERLRAAGVTVFHHRYDSLVHGFLSLAGVVRAAHAAFDEVCTEIVQLLG